MLTRAHTLTQTQAAKREADAATKARGGHVTCQMTEARGDHVTATAEVHALTHTNTHTYTLTHVCTRKEGAITHCERTT
jgi:hypothetical protein